MKKNNTKTSKQKAVSDSRIEPISLENTDLFFEEIPVADKHPITNENMSDYAPAPVKRVRRKR